MPILFFKYMPLSSCPYSRLKGGITTCLYYFLYRRLSVHVHTTALREAAVHAHIISYIHASQFLSIQRAQEGHQYMPILFPIQTPLKICPYDSLKWGISTCLFYFLYRRLSVHVHTATLREASVHAYIISYIDASQYMSIWQPQQGHKCMLILFPVQAPHSICPYSSLKRGISTCLYYFLYRRLSVHVHTAALRETSVHAYIISYIDASQIMSIQHP
jgi:hypothetical protein